MAAAIPGVVYIIRHFKKKHAQSLLAPMKLAREGIINKVDLETEGHNGELGLEESSNDSGEVSLDDVSDTGSSSSIDL